MATPITSEPALNDLIEGLAYPQEAEFPWDRYGLQCCGHWPTPRGRIIPLYRGSMIHMIVCAHQLSFGVCWGHVPGGGVGWSVNLENGEISESYKLERLKKF